MPTYDAVAAVVAHEYFHNWSGNRVTCRDWFQLSLKEGFTVFRDQQLLAPTWGQPRGEADRGRPRCSGPPSSPRMPGRSPIPMRPDSYLEIANFYTATVYSTRAPN